MLPGSGAVISSRQESMSPWHNSKQATCSAAIDQGDRTASTKRRSPSEVPSSGTSRQTVEWLVADEPRILSAVKSTVPAALGMASLLAFGAIEWQSQREPELEPVQGPLLLMVESPTGQTINRAD